MSVFCVIAERLTAGLYIFVSLSRWRCAVSLKLRVNYVGNTVVEGKGQLSGNSCKDTLN